MYSKLCRERIGKYGGCRKISHLPPTFGRIQQQSLMYTYRETRPRESLSHRKIVTRIINQKALCLNVTLSYYSKPISDVRFQCGAMAFQLQNYNDEAEILESTAKSPLQMHTSD